MKVLLLVATCLLLQGVSGAAITCDSAKNKCSKLAATIASKGARFKISEAVEDSVLEGTLYSDDGTDVDFQIKLNKESKSEYGKGEAWLGKCEGPKNFDIENDNIEGEWDVKVEEYKIQVFFNGDLKVDYVFLDDCSKQLSKKSWNGVTLKGLGSAKIEVVEPSSGYDKVGSAVEGGKACEYAKDGEECNKILLVDNKAKGMAIWVSTEKSDAKIKFDLYAGDSGSEAKFADGELSIDVEAEEESERGLARLGDCGKDEPFKFYLPKEVTTLNGEWITQFGEKEILVWWNKLPLITLPYTEECAASFLESGKVKAIRGITFKDVTFDYYYGYPVSDLSVCKFAVYSDMECRRVDNRNCAILYQNYCGCGGGMYVSDDDKCEGEKPANKEDPCKCEKECFWEQEPGICSMLDDYSCSRRVYSYCSCGEDKLCDPEFRFPTEKGACMDYECYGSGSAKLMGTSSIILLLLTAAAAFL